MNKLGLKQKRVLLTRPLEGMEEFQRKLDFQGAEIISYPMIQLSLTEDQTPLNKAFDNLEVYDWVVFNSSAAVRFFFQRAEEFGLKLYFYPDLKFATVGEKTKMTLEQLGYRTNFVPIKYTAEVLAANMPDIEGKKILIPASELTSENYLDVFQKRGAQPELIQVYQNVPTSYNETEKENLRKQKIDFLTFTSGSTVKAFQQLIGNPALLYPEGRVVCIGPSTLAVAEELGWKVDGMANPHTVEGMIEKMIELANELMPKTL